MNKKGYAMAIILMIVVILGVLAVPLTNLMLSETKASIRLGDQTQAYYIARSGVVIANEIMTEAINDNTYETYDDATITHSYGGVLFK